LFAPKARKNPNQSARITISRHIKRLTGVYSRLPTFAEEMEAVGSKWETFWDFRWGIATMAVILIASLAYLASAR
jgi:hypothetical protein